ncbi:hypothetical protein P4J60_26695 [Bacillus cereus]|nr:hypothetical protein [Bacillus cereus]MEB9570805.1 hypothetical protein [Bacillus cereus]
MKVSQGKSKRAREIQEYDLAYICYYSEKIELSSIGVGFSPNFSVEYLENLIQDLKQKGKFDYYKSIYTQLLNGMLE